MVNQPLVEVGPSRAEGRQLLHCLAVGCVEPLTVPQVDRVNVQGVLQQIRIGGGGRSGAATAGLAAALPSLGRR